MKCLCVLISTWATAEKSNICVYADRPWLKADDIIREPDEPLAGDLAREVRHQGKWRWRSREHCLTCAARMNEGLLRGWNERVRPGDTVLHIGDFCCKGNERGMGGDKSKAQYWLEQLHGTKVMILGNHDRNNSLPRGLLYGAIEAGNLKIGLIHNPHDLLPGDYDVVACGHVHRAWAWRFIGGRLYVNVGVDVRNYRLMRLVEFVETAKKILRENPDRRDSGLQDHHEEEDGPLPIVVADASSAGGGAGGLVGPVG